MKKIIFATGNDNKFYEASTIGKTFDVILEQMKIDVDEIQHHNPIEITKAKVQAAWAEVKEPVVVTDHCWNIPALGGFPGGYMKDVNAWFTPDDFLVLMSNKDDKRVFLEEVVAYYDGTTLKLFTHTRPGHFVDKPKGKSDPSFGKVVEMEGEGMTISEVFDKGDWDTNFPDKYKSWYDFYEWYTN
ncbi:MAG: RdgB/HAM1 family non-canonical purine pyrophosphatase, dITP/XTP pyrophosphatase [Candidatus Saccharibacteria bacterium]|nr:RdgB/HAM1 family non-canonical purine pyrophosphatase, dITP/XTP pyrophosphatase [Candidatus Saccharibacteria bacterium]